MNTTTKAFVLTVFSVLVLALVSGFASAQVFNMDLISQPSSVQASAGSFQVVFNVTYTGSATDFDFNLTSSAITGTISSVTFNQANPITLAPGQTKQITATVNFPAGQTGSISGLVTGDPSGSAASDAIQFNVPIAGSGASMTLAKTQEMTKTQNGIIQIQNTGAVPISNIQLSSTGDFSVTFNPTTFSVPLAPGATTSVNVIRGTSNLKFGTNTVSVKAMGLNGASNVSSNTVSFSLNNNFCRSGRVGDLEITRFTIDNRGDGKDNSWELLDEIEVEVKVENNGDDDVDDVLVELGIFDSTGRNVVDDFDFISADEEETDLGDLGDGDSETVTYEFRVPADVDVGSYRVTAKAYSDGEESTHCTDEVDGSDFEEVDIDKKDDEGEFIGFDDFSVSPSELICGSNAAVEVEAFNIGDEDQDQVRINMRIPELNVEEAYEIRNDLDEGDSEVVRFDFTVPSNAQTKSYNIEFTADYDYNNGNYRENTDDKTTFPVRVICAGSGAGSGSGSGTGSGTGSTSGRIAAISAVLDSDALAGQELIINALVTNIGNEEMSYVVSVNGFDDWASLEDISDRVVDIAPGQSEEIAITLMVDEDISGEQNLEIEVASGGKTESREVSVEIEGSDSPSGAFSGFNFGENGYLWIIGAINVILIVLIIVVAVRISRR